MKQQKCERCGTTKQTTEYGTIGDEDSGIITCKVCDKKLSKMLEGLHFQVKDRVKEERDNKEYEERIKSVVGAWKERPLSKKEKAEMALIPDA